MKNVIGYLVLIFVCTALSVEAYLDGRPPRKAGRSFSVDYPPYQASNQHPPFHEQHQPFREQSYRMRSFKTYRHASPYRQRVLSDPSIFRDYPSFRRQSHYRDQPLRDGLPFKNAPTFKRDMSYDRPVPPYRNQMPFRSQQSYTTLQPSSLPFRDYNTLGFTEQQYKTTHPNFFEGKDNLTNGQSYTQAPFKEPTPYKELEQQEFGDDPPSYTDAISSYEEDEYEKPMDSYREQERQSLSYGDHADYLKYGNHGLGFVSIPPMNKYDSPLPLSDDGTTTESIVTNKPLPPTTVSPMTPLGIDNYSPQSSQSVTLTKMTGSATSTTTQVKAQTLAGVSSTPSTPLTSMVPTMASISVTPKQTSNLEQNSKQMPSTSSIPMEITKTMITSFDMKPNLSTVTPQPVNVVTSGLYIPGTTKSNIQDSVLNYLLISQDAKQALNNNAQPYVNYVLPQVPRQELSNNLQDTLLKYVLSEESKGGLSFQPLQQAETLNYRPPTLAARPKFTLPIGLSQQPAIPRQLQTINYLPPAIPRVSFTSPGSTALSPSSGMLPIGIPNSLTAGIRGALPGSISGGISAGIPGSMSGSIPASIPALNFGQSFQHAEQIQQFGETRSRPYGTGLQLQLGGFGGLDYALQSSNPVARPMELGIAKVGLNLPELPRPHVPAFAKIGFGQHLLQFAH